ncbi:MAG: 7TM diverse intracellular signaling domain-containing protein, partial [Cytophagales bacterium]
MKNMKIPIRLLTLLILLSATTFAFKPEIVINEHESDRFLYITDIEVFEDFEKKLDFNDILKPEIQSLFGRGVSNNEFMYVNEKSNLWIKFSIKLSEPSSKRWVLENQDHHITKFEFFKTYGNENEIKKKTAGFGVKFREREYEHKNFVFDLPIDTSLKTFYIKASSDERYVIKLKVRSGSFFTTYALQEYFYLGLFYGIILIMAAYNSLVYFSTKEKVYIYYVLYALSSALIAMTEDGLGFQFLWPNLPDLNQIIALFSPLFLMITFSVYSKEFLEIHKYPLLNTSINFTLWFSVLFFIIRIFFLNLDWHFPFYLLPFLVIFMCSIFILKQGVRTARFFVVGHAFMLIGIILLILRLNNYMIMGSSVLTVYSFNIGLLLEIVIFSYAMADRIRLLELTKNEALELNQKAQIQIIDQLKENERLKDQLNKELNNLVELRTSELKNKNHQLEEAFLKLNEQSQKIEEMNALLNKENQTLHQNVEEITKARILMQDIDTDEFSKIFPDKEACMVFLSDLKWKNGYTCIKCGNNKFCDGREPMSRRCTKCRHDESPTANTIFHKLKFPITKAFYMLYLIYATKEKITT